MKYGIFFLLIAALMLTVAIKFGGWYFTVMYPALSFAIVAIGYLGVGPRVFGKRPNGRRSFISTFLLFPYLLFTLLIWHMIRLVSREPAVSQVDAELYLSRRLLCREVPRAAVTGAVKSVVDLTCEFPALTFASIDYLCFPMLDASCPSADELRELAERILDLPKPTLIHCAQGHGRTGLVAAAVLLMSGKASTPAEALAVVKASRPGIELNTVQRKTLEYMSQLSES